MACHGVSESQRPYSNVSRRVDTPGKEPVAAVSVAGGSIISNGSPVVSTAFGTVRHGGESPVSKGTSPGPVGADSLFDGMFGGPAHLSGAGGSNMSVTSQQRAMICL